MINKILIVDDSEVNNALLTEALRNVAKTEICAFTNPLEALDFLRRHAQTIDVAIFDHEMPGLTGIELIRAARVQPGFEHVPIIMVTSSEQRGIRREAFQSGATDFIGKPIDPVEIKARVGNLLALNQARRDQQDRAAWLAREVAAAVAVIEAREREIVTRLARVAEHRDTDTGDHVLRVARYSRIIAEGLGCEALWCNRLELAATMHDIGKVAVPDAILLKQGRLSDHERQLIMRHAEDGYQILQGSASDVVQLAADVAFSHHERWDGGGYPRGLAGTAIPLGGRIVAVADVFDALTSGRPYKSAWSFEDARHYLERSAGSQFDPDCVGAFLNGWSDVVAVMRELHPASMLAPDGGRDERRKGGHHGYAEGLLHQSA